MDGMCNIRVSSHIVLREITDTNSGDRTGEAAELIHLALCRTSRARPRIGAAVLYPHGGNGGSLPA